METAYTGEKRGLSSNSLKLIAVAAMLFDHIICGFFSHSSVLAALLRIPGRITAPIMCYMIAEGYYHTSNRKKYILRLLLFAVISHIPYDLYFRCSILKSTGVIWSLTLGLIALTAVKSEKLHIAAKFAVLVGACILAVPGDWGYVAVLWIVVFGIFRGSFIKQAIGFAVVGLVFSILPAYPDSGVPGIFFWVRFGIFLAIPLLFAYNGTRGRKSKFITWSFYVFYPAHLIILYIIRLFIER